MILIRLSGALLLLVFLFSVSLAQDVPRFYGEEVVVTALRVPRLKSAIPWNTKLITRKDIEESPLVKLGDLLRTVAGLSVKANGGLSSPIAARFRGSNSQQVLVLLNGSRINSPSLGMFDLGDILLSDVERIEVVKAPLSALYGADAVGGVVNIITRKATAKPEFEVAAGYGEFSTQNFSVSGSGPHYFFSAASLSSAGFRDNSDYKAQDLNLRFSGKMGKAYLEAGVKRYSGEKGSPGSLDYLTPQARQTDNNLFYDVIYRADEVGLKICLAQNSLGQNYKNPASFTPIDTTNKTLTTNLNVQETLDLGRFNAFSAGIEIREDHSQGTNSGSQHITDKAVYLQDEIHWPGVARIVVGGREDLTSAYGNHFNPRIGLVVNPWRDVDLKASWGSSFKAPSINDLYWSSLTETFDWGGITYVSTTRGNPDLKAETAQSIDVSLERRLDSESSARLSYYVSDIRDMIRWTTTYLSTTESVTEPLNVSNASIQGVEFEYERKILEILNGFVNFTYQLAKDKDTDKFLDYAPQYQLNTGVKHRGRFGVTSNFIVRYIGERYADLANNTKLAGYTVVDASFSRDFGKWSVKLDVENLFDESYAESYGFTDVYPMPGRRYNIGVSCKI